MYFGCAKEPSHEDGPFEYPQHRFWLRNMVINYTLFYLGAWIFWSHINHFLNVPHRDRI